MSIDTADKLVAALQALDREQIHALPPAERRRLAEALVAAHRVAIAAEMTPPAGKAGVLADLAADGRGRQ
jgi:hypothetical protein